MTCGLYHVTCIYKLVHYYFCLFSSISQTGSQSSRPHRGASTFGDVERQENAESRRTSEGKKYERLHDGGDAVALQRLQGGGQVEEDQRQEDRQGSGKVSSGGSPWRRRMTSVLRSLPVSIAVFNVVNSRTSLERIKGGFARPFSFGSVLSFL